MSRLRLNFSKPHFNWELDLLCWQIIMFSSCCLYQFDCLDYSLIKDQLFFIFKYKGPMMKMLKNEKSRDGGGAKHCDKGTVQNKKYHNLWKKSKRGGRGQGQNQKSLHFKCRLTLTEGGSKFFRFFPNLNNWNMTFIFMIYQSL